MVSSIKIIRFCFLVAMLFFSISTFAQINIFGRVVTERENTPIPNAAVYLNNTTIGTITDNLGNFNLDSVKLLNTDMVIACKGYEVLVFKPTTEQIQNKKIVVKLQPKQLVAKDRRILESTAQREYALNLFYENLLGVSEEASKCTIENESSIHFMQGDNSTSFVAYADTPLIIINHLLGYKMRFDLSGFSYDEATGQNYFLTYILYQKLGDNKKWINNRRNIYLGSSMHFFRSLIANQLYNEGYYAYLIPALHNNLKANMPTALLGTGAEEERSRAVPVSAQDILYIDSTNKYSIKVDGSLIIQYLRTPSSKKYLMKHSFYEGMLKRGVESYLEFKTPIVGLNSAGVLSNPSSVVCTGFWMYERTANTLPFDYSSN